MRKNFLNSLVLRISLLISCVLAIVFQNDFKTLIHARKISHAQITTYGSKLPIRFERNDGQAGEQVDFLTRGKGCTLFLTASEAVLNLWNSETRSHSAQEKPESQSSQVATALRMQLVGANSEAKAQGLDERVTKSNYLIGNNSEKWLTNIPNYGRVKYQDIYPGIDVVYYGRQGKLEYDFVLAPGADPNVISLQFEGSEDVSINMNGNLNLSTAAGKVTMQAPLAYQDIAGVRENVSARYVWLSADQIGFEVGDYEPAAPLVIDPVLVFSTYLGGTGADEGTDIAVDSLGNAYITGYSTGTFPTTDGVLQPTYNGPSSDAIVAKLNASDSELIYATFIGGGRSDRGLGIAIDDEGNAYITGHTNSTDFPTQNAIQPNFGGDANDRDGFVVKLNPTGSALVYSTYLGGSGFESARDIAVDRSGNAYIVGNTSSSNFPTKNAIQGAKNGGSDSFVTKINSTGTELVFSTYLGGSETEDGHGITVDRENNVYIIGKTTSDDFPTVLPLQTAGGSGDAFVTKINAQGSALVYSTYLAGVNDDIGTAIVVDSLGSAYVVGSTTSPDFPINNAVQPNYGFFRDCFVAKFTAAGDSLLYSTYLGGTSVEGAPDIAVDAAGNAYITGFTLSIDFPTQNPLQSTLSRAGLADAFVTKIGPAGLSIEFSSYLGGSGSDFSSSVAVDGNRNIYLTGWTNSADFPLGLAPPIQNTLGGSGDAFVAKIELEEDRTINSINFSGVAIDLDQPTPGLFPPQSDFTSITIRGTNLGKVNDIDFLPVQNNAIMPRNIKASDSEVSFELSVRHDAILGNRDIVMFTEDDQEIQVTNLLGTKFLVTAVRSQFNQAIDTKEQIVERDGRLGLFEDKLVASKRGVVRIQFEDSNQLNRVFEGNLIATESTDEPDQVFPHRVKDNYDRLDLIIGLDYLTLPIPKPLKAGTQRFNYILERDDGLGILGPIIEKEVIESRELRIHAVSYKITQPDGSVLMPPSDAAVRQSMELLKKIYPISSNKLSFFHAGTRELPDIGEFTDIFEISGATTNIKNSGRDLLAAKAYEVLDEANTEALFNDAADFHLQLVFLPDIGKDWAGVAYAQQQIALIATSSSSKSVQTIVPHEIGHLLAAVLRKDFDLPVSLQRELEGELGLGDEYNGGVYYCSVNPPIKQNKGWVVGKDESCISSPFELNRDGDTVGIYTNLTAYNPYDHGTMFTDQDLSPKVIKYNIMGRQGDAKTWVSNRTYSRLMKYLIPSEADNESIAKVASLQNDGIQINGVIFRNGGGSIDRVVKTNSHYRSPNAGGGYSVDLVDTNNNTLNSRIFSATFVSVSEPPEEIDAELFTIQMDFDEQVQNVSLKKDGIELASFKISSNEPQVQILQPESHQMFTDEIEIKWSASDADGDSLEYSIIYETDDGVYLPVVAGLRDTSYTWNLVHFPGSLAGTIIVVANDGFHRARDRQTFGKARSAPTIAITAPKDGATVNSDSVLIIAATGYDLEDGLLPDSSFIFTSDVDGELGQGSPLIVSELSTGPHTITASATDKDGKTGFASVTISYLVTGVNEDAENRLPEDFALYQNYPNPFNASTIIRFDLPKATDVNITIFNVLGQRVQVLTDRKYPIGQHQLRWSGHGKSGLTVASGIYIYRIRVGDFIQSRKMLLLR